MQHETIMPDGITPEIRKWMQGHEPHVVAKIDQGTFEVADLSAKEWRKVVTSAPDWPGVMSQTGINSGSLTKADCQALAVVLGRTKNGVPLEDEPSASQAPAKAEPSPAKPAPAKTAEERAGEILQDILAGIGRGDITAPRDRLTILVEANDQLQAAVEAAKSAPKPSAHPAPGQTVNGPVQPVGTLTLRELAPKATADQLPGRTGALTLTRYSGTATADPHYSPDPKALAALAACDVAGRNVWLYGPAGTGKSSLPAWYAAKLGRPFFRVSFDRSTEPEDLIGGMEPDGKGGMHWRDGVLAQAIRQAGAVVLLDEPTFARPTALAMLQTLLDGGRHLLARATGERIDCAPGVMFVCADNTSGTGDETGQYSGTSGMNRAFLDRMAARVFVGYMDRAKEKAVLAARAGLPEPVAHLLVDFASRTRAAARNGDMAHALGFRRLEAWAGLIGQGLPSADAFGMTCLAGEAPDDEETLRQMATAHLDHAAIDRALSA